MLLAHAWRVAAVQHHIHSFSLQIAELASLKLPLKDPLTLPCTDVHAALGLPSWLGEMPGTTDGYNNPKHVSYVLNTSFTISSVSEEYKLL